MRTIRWTVGIAAILWVLTQGCGGATTGQTMTGNEPQHHTHKGFKNLNMGPKKQEKGLMSVLKMRFSSQWADHGAEAYQVPITPVEMDKVENPRAPQAVWIGHSTFLIQVNGMNILTDPVFSKRASPVSWAGPKRYTEPAMTIDELPPIDAVVISHNHYDHLDLPSIEALGNDPVWLVPLRNKHILEHVGVTNVVELDWWESHTVNGWTFTATPVQHWSARSLTDRFECLWSGWVGEREGFRFYFAGDTGYNEVDFRETGERFGSFDLSLIPIGAYAPRWFMRTFHINPDEAVRVHQDTNSRFSLGIHWGTFPLTAESPGDPPRQLERALAEAGLPPEVFLAVPIGSVVEIPARDVSPAEESQGLDKQ